MLSTVESAQEFASAALSCFDIPAGADVSLVKHRENFVFRVDADGRRFALRIHRFGLRTDAEIAAELDLLRQLAEAGADVPRMVPTRDGAMIARLPDADRDVHQIDLAEWIDDASPWGDIGQAFLDEGCKAPMDFHDLGRLIGDVHNRAAALNLGGHGARRAWDADGLVGPQPLWGDPLRAFPADHRDREVMMSALAWLRDRLQGYGRDGNRYGLIHADFTPENVLVTPAGLTVIDFDDFGDGWYLFDLATAAFFYLPQSRFEDMTEALFGGYRSVHPLTTADRAMWLPMLLARGLTYLGWATDRIGDETSDFILAHVRPAVVGLAGMVIGSSESTVG